MSTTYRIGACLSFDWGRSILEDVSLMLNDRTDGLWDDLIDEDTTVEIKWYNDSNDDRNAVDLYWEETRSHWGSQLPHGIVGCKTSDSSEGLAQITSLEDIPVISPSSTSYRLEEFSNFFRTIAPDDEGGQVGALVSLLTYMKWQKVTVLGTDTLYSRDLASQFNDLWTSKGNTIVHDFFIANTSNIEDIEQAFGDIPTDPAIKSRIILLIATENDASQILQVATAKQFQPDTIWIATEGWTNRINVRMESSIALGLKPYVEKKGELFETFFNNSVFGNSKEWEAQGLPVYAAETVDAVLAFVHGLDYLSQENRSDGLMLMDALKQVNFTGITGQVRFDKEKRFKVNPKFTLAYYDGSNQKWTDVGIVKEKSISVSSPGAICWPSPWDCGFDSIPPDFYIAPMNYLFHFIFIPMCLIVVSLLLCILFHKKKMIEMEKKLSEKDNVDQQLVAITDEVERMKLQQSNLLLKREELTAKPNSWTETSNVLVPILPSDEEYWIVHSSLKGDSRKMEDAWISKLWRIQNMHLWTFYSFRLELLKRTLGDSGLNETMVWHGTGITDPSIIYNDTQDGFMTQVSKKGKWGNGTYFASESSYSNRFAYQPHQDAPSDRPPNAGNEHEMFFAKLLVGNVIQMKTEDRSLKVPPFIAKGTTKRYNTVQGESGGSKIWVVYENGRAYPEYLLRYYIGPRDPNRTPFSSREESLLASPTEPEDVAHSSEMPQVPNITWQYEDSDGWQSFNLDLQTVLETAYQRYFRESHLTDFALIRFKFRKWEYELNFDSMIQTNVSHAKHRQRRVRRLDDCAV